MIAYLYAITSNHNDPGSLKESRSWEWSCKKGGPHSLFSLVCGVRLQCVLNEHALLPLILFFPFLPASSFVVSCLQCSDIKKSLKHHYMYSSALHAIAYFCTV